MSRRSGRGLAAAVTLTGDLERRAAPFASAAYPDARPDGVESIRRDRRMWQQLRRRCHTSMRTMGPMCQMCDGMSADEVRQDLLDRKDKWGWALQGVTARPPWTYTVGLVERYRHPELVLAGVPIEAAFHVLNALGTRIAIGERLEPGTEGVRVGETELRFAAVHPVHIAAGLVGAWEDAYRDDPEVLARLAVVQVLIVPERRQPRLDRAFTTLRI